MARFPIEHQVPIDFALPDDPARIQPGHGVVRGVIEVEGRPPSAPTRSTQVLTRGAGEDVALRLVRATETCRARGGPDAGRGLNGSPRISAAAAWSTGRGPA